MVSEVPNGTRPLGAGASALDAGVPAGDAPRASPPRAPLAPGPSEPDKALPLRLALARGALGVELNRPEQLGQGGNRGNLERGPLEVRELAFSLPDLRYPLDLSKGVKQFRNRRGRLQRLVLQASLLELGKWLEESWRDLLGEPPLGARVWPLPIQGSDPLATAARGLGFGLYSASRSLAFDLLWCPQDGPRFVLHRPRGLGIEVPSAELALRALDALVNALPVAERQGRLLALPDAPAAVCRAVLPNYGYRVPATQSMKASALEVREGDVELAFDVDHEAPESSREILLALESALHLRAADDSLASGESDAAREALLEVLGNAAGLPAAVHALAELDVAVPGRQEAALATLEDVGGAEAAGALGAQILAAAGHVERAREALGRAGEAEVFGPLAAQLLCRAAQLADHPSLRVSCLDRAVARAPQLASARWLRFEDRVRRGDAPGALSDAQHLEAAATTLRARHAACLRAGRRLGQAGHGDVARRLLERALRYAPDDPAARAALGRVFADLGMRSRAVSLLQGAIEADRSLSEGGDALQDEALLDLARLLGDGLDDLPQAIARSRQVSARSALSVQARALEADYCERLGDIAGAARAYGRVREAVELGWTRDGDALRALRRGAKFEEGRGELAMAERHLYAALSLAPRDEELRAEYRRVAALSARPGRGSAPEGD